MSQTAIEWTDATWNPVRGCSRVSQGCRECYAEREAMRIVRMDRGAGKPVGRGAYDGLVTLTKQGPKWTGKVRELMHKLGEPIRWKQPRRIFVNSMSDLFHKGVSDVFIADVFAAMAYARQHTFQVLTKRPQRMQQLLTSEAFAELYEQACSLAHDEACEVLGRRGEFSPHERLTTDIRAMDPTLPRPNIWLGVSVEDQATANERIPLLLRTPAAVRFISAEPLLGPVDLTPHLWGRPKPCDDCPKDADCECGYARRGKVFNDPALHWVIAGGESGAKARPMYRPWLVSLRDQCQAGGVPFFFKRWGEWLPGEEYTPELQERDCDLVQSRYRCAQLEEFEDGHLEWDIGRPLACETGEEALFRVGKKAAGRSLYGREWNEYPEVRHGHD